MTFSILHGAKRDGVQHMMMDVKQIRTHPMFANLLRVEPGMQEKITESMRVHGFFQSQPLVLAVWPGQEEPALADGNTRIQAALAVGITHVPVVIVRFDNEMEVLQRVIQFQADRRTTEDGALYSLCAQFDRLMESGRPRKNGETEKLTTRVVNFVGPSASARKTAQLLGCNFRNVESIRKIRRDGWPEIQEAVRNDEMKINKAYKLIRDMKLGKEDGEKKASVRLTKAVQTVLGEDVFENMRNLEGDLLSLVKTACEEFIRRRADQEHSEIQERK